MPSILGRRILHAVLYLSILISPVVFIQPAPYEGFMALLLLAGVIAGTAVDPMIFPLLLLIVIFDACGLMATTAVLAQPDIVSFFGISVYLGLTAILFACIFTQDSARRLQILRNAYIVGGVLTAITGIIGYFNLLPHAEVFMFNQRASGTFKDSNVFGPFLVPPIAFLIQNLITRGLKLRTLGGIGIMLAGVFLSFSRGAWGNFVISTVIMLFLMFATASTVRARGRIIVFSTIAVACVILLLVGLMSIEPIRNMFLQRASLLQDYDVGHGGRFGLQELSLQKILEFPQGMGALEFGRLYEMPPHNVYLGVTVSYGWLAGLAWIAHTLIALTLGLRAVVVRTPWQVPFCAVYACYVGIVLEGLIIDTDHWRHYYLLLGLVWGLSIATIRYARQQRRLDSPQMRHQVALRQPPLYSPRPFGA